MENSVILIGLGANLPGRAGSPRQTLEAALVEMAAHGLVIAARSHWWRSAPVPVSDQPWYLNGVAALADGPGPAALLALLQGIEDRLGRVRAEPNGARAIDLDLLAHGRAVIDRPGLVVPHPRLHERAFVLLPLAEIAPDWVHPGLNRSIGELIAHLPVGQVAEPLA